jgi:hypothetical protein
MNIIAQFSGKQNLSMLWDVLLDELHVNTTNKTLLSNIKLVFDSNINPFTNRINVNTKPNLMELNKQFLRQVFLAVNKLFPKEHNENIQRIKITNEEVLEPYKIEDIHASRQSEFEKEVIRKKTELEQFMTPQKPRELDFSDKMSDNKITAMDSLVAKKMAERNEEIELLQNTNYNTSSIDKEKWLSSMETSVKGEKIELRINELTNNNLGNNINNNNKLKHISIDNENNIVLQKEKKVSWSNDEPVASIFQKLKKRPEEQNNDLLVTKETDYERQMSSGLPEVKQQVIHRKPLENLNQSPNTVSNNPVIPKNELAKQINDISAKIDDLYSIVTKLTSIIESQTLVSATDILETDVRS